MRARIISIGDELLRGRILDSNSAFISRHLLSLGIETERQDSVGDDIKAISKVIEDTGENKIIFVTGGLGPTDDDITRSALSEIFNRPLARDRESEEAIKKIFEKRGRVASERNLDMAAIPSGSTAIRNEWGSAPGFILESEGRIFYVMPGVPYELENMFLLSVMPDLKRRFPGLPKIERRMFRMCGIPESGLNDELNKIRKPSGVAVGFYPRFPELSLEIHYSKKNDVNAAKIEDYLSEITDKFSDHIFATDDSKIEEKLVDALIKNKLTLAVAESCTGGLIAATIVNVAGSSACFDMGVVTYSNRAKQELLGIESSLLDKYGAVSAECAKKMAHAVRERAKSDIGVAVTGIAGPSGGTREKPVGTVFIAFSTKRFEVAERLLAFRDRNGNRQFAMYEVFFRLLKIINGNYPREER